MLESDDYAKHPSGKNEIINLSVPLKKKPNLFKFDSLLAAILVN